VQTLVNRIAQKLKTEKHCAVYETELTRVWPRPDPLRESKIGRFAKDHGWRMRFYREGLCAIFDQDQTLRSRKAG
jgi:hypothetical protein